MIEPVAAAGGNQEALALYRSSFAVPISAERLGASELGKGSMFTFTIPVRHANELVLIVEDNPKSLKLVRDTLQVEGDQLKADELAALHASRVIEPVKP